MTSGPPKFMSSLPSGPLSLGGASSVPVNPPTAVVHVLCCGPFQAPRTWSWGDRTASVLGGSSGPTRPHRAPSPCSVVGSWGHFSALRVPASGNPSPAAGRGPGDRGGVTGGRSLSPGVTARRKLFPDKNVHLTLLGNEDAEIRGFLWPSSQPGLLQLRNQPLGMVGMVLITS